MTQIRPRSARILLFLNLFHTFRKQYLKLETILTFAPQKEWKRPKKGENRRRKGNRGGARPRKIYEDRRGLCCGLRVYLRP